jgi:hypothetical protein
MARIVSETFTSLDSRAISQVTAVLNSMMVRQKQRDAVKALEILKAGAFQQPREIDFVMTDAFARDLEDSGLDPASLMSEGLVS